MQAEAFPIRFTRGVRKYHRLEAGGDSKATQTQQLGRRLRVRVRALMRARDAYVGGMLVLAKKASAVALPASFWAKRKQLPAAGTGQPTEFEQRLIFEIYKSIVASKELTTMLHSSTTTRTPTVHLLDM